MFRRSRCLPRAIGPSPLVPRRMDWCWSARTTISAISGTRIGSCCCGSAAATRPIARYSHGLSQDGIRSRCYFGTANGSWKFAERIRPRQKERRIAQQKISPLTSNRRDYYQFSRDRPSHQSWGSFVKLPFKFKGNLRNSSNSVMLMTKSSPCVANSPASGSVVPLTGTQLVRRAWLGVAQFSLFANTS